jgi:hypothetical protein
MWKDIATSSLLAGFCTWALILSITVSFAQVMQSGSYQIQSDSINFGGGLSTSSNYTLESTAGEIATGGSDSETYSLRAGYQQMQEVYIALSGATDVVLTPSIPGMTGGISNGSTTVSVVTDSPSGYMLTIAGENSPAMSKDADVIADYVPEGIPPDFAFITGPADAHFGYSPEGTDIADRFLDDGAVCDAGNGDTSLACWDGLSTTEEIIASQTGSNHPDGATTTIHFRVGVGGSALQAPGIYTATTTVTALPL